MGNKRKSNQPYTPELLKAKRELFKYMDDHHIKPENRKVLNDPIHGPILKKLISKLNKERDKVMVNYPAADTLNNLKLINMAKNKEKKVKKTVQEAPVEKKASKATKYDYPQVKDEKTGKMREMTSDEKKKYRIEARKKANGGAPKAKKENTPVKVKKENKAKKEEAKKEVKADKKKKKAKKEED